MEHHVVIDFADLRLLPYCTAKFRRRDYRDRLACRPQLSPAVHTRVAPQISLRFLDCHAHIGTATRIAL